MDVVEFEQTNGFSVWLGSDVENDCSKRDLSSLRRRSQPKNQGARAVDDSVRAGYS